MNEEGYRWEPDQDTATFADLVTCKDGQDHQPRPVEMTTGEIVAFICEHCLAELPARHVASP